MPSPSRSSAASFLTASCSTAASAMRHRRSEEHTSELQSRQYLVCRLLLEKKKKTQKRTRKKTCTVAPSRSVWALDPRVPSRIPSDMTTNNQVLQRAPPYDTASLACPQCSL